MNYYIKNATSWDICAIPVETGVPIEELSMAKEEK